MKGELRTGIFYIDGEKLSRGLSADKSEHPYGRQHNYAVVVNFSASSQWQMAVYPPALSLNTVAKITDKIQ